MKRKEWPKVIVNVEGQSSESRRDEWCIGTCKNVLLIPMHKRDIEH